ncbi:MAG: hypothetical protein GWQ05_08710 [Verrucomicrobiaceae bacterium]|nr:hypothetical protein [Verrucomicrobiaceae bacterium]NCF91025.1 hypothetical protein [Verrucomicrobiaceae bacterium]
MKKDTLIVKRRKPVDAASMSALLPGLGQIYCGDIRRGILWMGASFSLLALAVVTLLLNSTRAGFSNTIGLFALDLLLCIVCAMHAWRLAKWSSPKKVDMDRTNRSVSLGVFSEFGSVD